LGVSTWWEKEKLNLDGDPTAFHSMKRDQNRSGTQSLVAVALMELPGEKGMSFKAKLQTSIRAINSILTCKIGNRLLKEESEIEGRVWECTGGSRAWLLFTKLGRFSAKSKEVRRAKGEETQLKREEGNGWEPSKNSLIKGGGVFYFG